LTVYKTDTCCAKCKNWITIYVSAAETPSKQSRVRYLCQCHGQGETTNVDFVAITAIAIGGIIGEVVAN
jgi:hypothetical protein